MAALRQEIRRGNNWKTAHNKAHENVVQVAIRTKNIEALKILVDHGASVDLENVQFYLQTFFNIDSSYFKTGYNDSFDNWLDLSPQTIEYITALLSALATAQTDDQKENITSIMNFFITGEDFSTYLGFTITNNNIKQLITKNLKNIFFKDQIPGHFCLKRIIKNLLAADNAQALLLFLIDLKNDETAHVLELPAPPANIPEEYRQSEQIAAALMEYARAYYQHLPNNAPFRYIVHEIPHNNLLKLIDFSDQLSIFVERSITSRKSNKRKIKNYKFWHQVYNSLMIRGDFMNSFSVAVGLGHSAVQRAIGVKYLTPDLTITDPTNSFKKYREATKLHGQGSYLPAIQIMFKDLASLKEMGIFSGAKLRPEILPFLVRHKQEMIDTLRFTQQTKLQCDPQLGKAINLMPTNDIATNTLLWQRIYRTIIKGQAYSW